MPIRQHYACLPEIAVPYVHAIRHQNVLYLSGLTAMGTPAEQGSLVEQTREILLLRGKLRKGMCRGFTPNSADAQSRGYVTVAPSSQSPAG